MRIMRIMPIMPIMPIMRIKLQIIKYQLLIKMRTFSVGSSALE